MAWDSVCSPKWAGGLGLPNLKWLNVAMQTRWPWLARVDASIPWTDFRIKVPREAMQPFWAATRSEARCGLTTLFWEDRWIDGRRAQEIAPTIYSRIPQRIKATMMVAPAIEDGAWAMEIGPNIGVQELHEFLELWTRVSTWEPQLDVPD